MPSLTLQSASNAPAKSGAIKDTGVITVPLNRYYVFVSIAVLGCAVDLITKECVFAWLGMPATTHSNVWWLWEPYVGIETALNRGALFGLGQGWSRLFALLSVGAGIAIPIWLFVYRAAASRWLTVSLSCIMAGVLGNLYDRVTFNCVRDWILFRYGDYTWPNFNIADSMLVCGAIMLFWRAWHEDKPKETATDTNEKSKRRDEKAMS